MTQSVRQKINLNVTAARYAWGPDLADATFETYARRGYYSGLYEARYRLQDSGQNCIHVCLKNAG